MRTRPALLLAAILFTVPVAASAADRVVVVELLSGGTVQGRLVDVVPGDHVTIQLPQAGTRRTIPWASLRRIAEPGAAPLPRVPDPETPAVVAPPEPPAAPAPAAGEVLVTVNAGHAVQLQKSRPDGGWDTACVSPCNVALPTDTSYRIVDNGRPQGGFRLLPNASGRVVVDVSLRSPAADIFGVALLVVGAGMALVAAANDSRGSSSNHGNTVPILGLLSLIGLGTGTALVATNGASVSQHPAAPDVAKDVPTRSTANELTTFAKRSPSATILSIRF